MIRTIDSISDGRIELGIGAGWKRDEWRRTATASPTRRTRLARSWRDDLEVVTAMLAGDRHEHATFAASTRSVRGAINVPKPIQQPRVPIMVGGNGPKVTWRLAARYADELNLDGLSPAEVTEALPVVRARCEEIGRDPATLPVSLHLWWGDIKDGGAARVDQLAAYRELGLSRVMGLVQASADTDEALDSLVEDARAAGVDLG